MSKEAFLKIIEDAKKVGKEHLRHSLKLIEQQLLVHGPDGVALSFNGGKDCTVLLYLIITALISVYGTPDRIQEVLIIYFEQGTEFPDVLSFMEEVKKRFHLKIEDLKGNYKEGLLRVLKDFPKIKSIFMGQRRIDPGMSDLPEKAPSSEGWPPFLRVNPILDWTYKEIWAFLREYNLPYCSLYDKGYTSLGCKTETQRNPKLKIHSTDPDTDSDRYLPAYMLQDDQEERCGRLSKTPKDEAKSPPSSPILPEEKSSKERSPEVEVVVSVAPISEEHSIGVDSTVHHPQTGGTVHPLKKQKL